MFVKTAISTFRVGKIILPLSSADGVKFSLPLGVTSASQTIYHGNRGRQNVDGCFLYGWEECGSEYGISAIEGGNAAAPHRRLGKASGGFRVDNGTERTATVGSPEVAVRQAAWNWQR